MCMNAMLTKFTKYMLDLMFFGGILVIITLPFSLRLFGSKYSKEIDENFLIILTIMGIAGVLGLMIIIQLRKMMKTVLEESCFVYENVRCLNRMAVLSLCISILFRIVSDSCAGSRNYNFGIFYSRLVQQSALVCICPGSQLQGRK